MLSANAGRLAGQWRVHPRLTRPRPLSQATSEAVCRATAAWEVTALRSWVPNVTSSGEIVNGDTVASYILSLPLRPGRLCNVCVNVGMAASHLRLALLAPCQEATVQSGRLRRLWRSAVAQRVPGSCDRHSARRTGSGRLRWAVTRTAPCNLCG